MLGQLRVVSMQQIMQRNSPSTVQQSCSRATILFDHSNLELNSGDVNRHSLQESADRSQKNLEEQDLRPRNSTVLDRLSLARARDTMTQRAARINR